MSLLSNTASKTKNARLTKIGLFIGLGLILFIFETLIPRPLPWLKLGFAHIVTLLALYLLDARAAVIVVLGRIFLGSLALGTFFNPTFFLSLCGGLGATLIMIIVKNRCNDIFSIFGVSISGAVMHNLIQLFVANWLIIHKIEIFYLLPLLILSAIFTGFVVALISQFLIVKFEK